MTNTYRRVFLIVLASAIFGLISCRATPEKADIPTPSPTDVAVKARFQLVEGPSYSADIQPIFNEFCVKCHGADRSEANLRLDSYETLMHGTRFGSIIVAGASDRSTLVYVIENPQAKELAMPKDSHKLSPNRIKNIRYWIDAGAKND